MQQPPCKGAARLSESAECPFGSEKRERRGRALRPLVVGVLPAARSVADPGLDVNTRSQGGKGTACKSALGVVVLGGVSFRASCRLEWLTCPDASGRVNATVWA